MSTTSDGEHSYPSWLPRRPPPPAPASTFHSTSGFDMHGRPGVLDIFSGAQTTTSPSVSSPAQLQGRKPTPRSVRIVARDAGQWRVGQAGSRSRLREQTGDSAETRVFHQHPNQSLGRHQSMFASTPHRPQPRFRAPSLHLDLLRSPTLFMRIRYRLHPIFVFGHLILQTFFDFNAVFMIIQTARHPGPMNNPKNWNLATVAYLVCYFLQIIVVFVLYQLVYSFWRRWRVKRPLILPIYLSSAAHDLAGLTSYTNYCFLAYIRRSARPSFHLLVRGSTAPLMPPTRTTAMPTSPSGSGSLHSRSPTNARLHDRSESISSTTTSNTSTSSAPFLSFLTPFTPYIAESAYFLSQNTPTVVLLLPRATLCVALLLQTPAGPGLGRDSTYFDANGALTSYARGILFTNAAWTLWRVVVLLGSFTTLWILSGSACAGICGPRYRWEEYPDPESEVEVDDEDGGWAFVSLNPWLRAHPRRHRRRRKRATSESIAYDREPEPEEPGEREHESITSSFFSPVSSPPIPSEIRGEHGVEASEKPSPPTSLQTRPVSPAQPRPPTRTTRHTVYTNYPTPPARAYMAEDLPLSDNWNWKRGTRRRIREAWEFCLTNSGGKWLGGSGSGGPLDSAGKKDGDEGDGDSPRTRAIIQRRAAVAAAVSELEGSGDNDISLDSEDFKGLDEVLKQSVLHRNALRSRPKLSPSAVGLSDIIPPPDDPLLSSPEPTTHADAASPSTIDPAFSSQFGSQRSRRSDPLRVLPFPLRVGPVGGDGTGKATVPATATTTTSLSPPPSAAPIASSSTEGTPAMPATPTTATTLTMTGIPFPSPTRSRLPTQTDEGVVSRTARGEEEGLEEEGEQEEQEDEEGEEDYEEEIEDYDDDFLEEEGEDEEEEDYDEFDPEADVEDYDEDYDLSGSPRVEEEELYYDEFGAPVTTRRRRHASTSARSGDVSRSGSASMSSLGKPIDGGVGAYGGYAFSTVGSATMSSVSRSAGQSGTRSASHGGSRIGTVSSRGSRGTRTSFSPNSASASVSASRSGVTGSGSAMGTRSSRGSASATASRGDSASRAGRVRGRGRGNDGNTTIGHDGSGQGKGRGRAAMVAGSASPQSQRPLSSASPHSHIHSLSPQTIASTSLSPVSMSSPHPHSSPSNGESQSSPSSQNQAGRNEPQSLASPHPLSSPPTVPLPAPPAVIQGQGSDPRRERRRPRRERDREYTGRLHVSNPPPHSTAYEHPARIRTDSSTIPSQLHDEPISLGAGDTSLDNEFPVPASAYMTTGGGRRSRRTSTAGTSTVGATTGRRRTRTMSSGFSGRGADLILPHPMPEGYHEDEEDRGGAGREMVEEGVSYLGRNRGGPLLADVGEGQSDHELENEFNNEENEDILGLLSSSRPSSGPVSLSGSAPASRPNSASASPHTRSPRSSLKSISSRPSLANLAVSLGANLTTGARHLGSRRVSIAGTPSRGSRSRSREGSFVQSASGGTLPPPLPLSQPSIRSRAQSLIQSIRNRSSSFVELVELGEDGGDEGAIPGGEDNSVRGDIREDDGDMTLALPPVSRRHASQTGTASRGNGDEVESRQSSPEHSSNNSPASNHNSLTHTPSSVSNSPPSRIIGVPRGFEFGANRRESSGTSSSSPSGGARSSGEGRRPHSLLSATSGLSPVGTGTEGTFGRPGELARAVRRERELAGEDVDVEGQRRPLSSGFVYLPAIPSIDPLNIHETAAAPAYPSVGERGRTERTDAGPDEGTRSGGVVTRTEPVSIPTSRQPPSPLSSPSAVSTAPASFITAPPSVAFTHTSTTESVPTAQGGGSGTDVSTGDGSSGRGANTSIDPLWRDQTRRGARGPVAGSWHFGPA